ncbi:MAG: DNA/RNA non-specific endonuclease [Prevotella sp.]|nr:DNA/RNA non-specific endonuclease [Prevotella sp.]
MKKFQYIISAALLMLAVAACRPSTDGNTSAQQAQEGEVNTLLEGATPISSNSQTTAQAENPKPAAQPKEMEIPVTVSGSEGQLLKRVGYTTSYNAQNKIPNWVAWRLTANHVNGNYRRDFMEFHEDTDIKAPRVVDNDYYNSGYDRGHMCPSGDNKWNKEAQEQSFLFTNVCPQNHNLNAGAWNDVEMQCRAWAKRYGTLYIVCGPVLKNQQHRTIGRNRVVVPEAFFKVILRQDTKTSKRSQASSPVYKAIGFVYENRSAKRDMKRFVRSIDEIEQLTGLDFFSNLPDDIEDAVEADAELRDWYPLMELKN